MSAVVSVYRPNVRVFVRVQMWALAVNSCFDRAGC